MSSTHWATLGRTEGGSRGAFGLQMARGKCFAVQAGEFGLGVESVYLRGASICKKVNHPFGFSCKLGRMRDQRRSTV